MSAAPKPVVRKTPMRIIARHIHAAHRGAMLATLETYHDAGRLSRVERAELLAEAREAEAEAEAERLEALAARALARFEACQRRLG